MDIVKHVERRRELNVDLILQHLHQTKHALLEKQNAIQLLQKPRERLLILSLLTYANEMIFLEFH